ncbi:hypothetical protein Ciccas_011321 [Cichlidogyrus casuarinus]|uniref:Uncharacterized protein n=1 Tax=Cichlidogyrus casuarinus TaxID=1844966 RepID=A0ABD2PT85_9PLAT
MSNPEVETCEDSITVLDSLNKASYTAVMLPSEEELQDNRPMYAIDEKNRVFRIDYQVVDQVSLSPSLEAEFQALSDTHPRPTFLIMEHSTDSSVPPATPPHIPTPDAVPGPDHVRKWMSDSENNLDPFALNQKHSLELNKKQLQERKAARIVMLVGCTLVILCFVLVAATLGWSDQFENKGECAVSCERSLQLADLSID